MTKNLKTTYILFIVMSAIIVAFSSIARYIGGTGVAFAGIITLLSFVIILNVLDQLVGKRIKDLLIIASIFTICEFIIYFFIDFIASWKITSVMFGIQNVISLLGIFFLAYVIFRFVCESKNVKVKFVEILLGNSTKQPKQKKNKKELENGSLDDKPTKSETELLPGQETINVETDNSEE